MQRNSFCNYVKRFYTQGFGLNPDKALLIDCDKIKLPEGRYFSEVFPDFHIIQGWPFLFFAGVVRLPAVISLGPRQKKKPDNGTTTDF